MSAALPPNPIATGATAPKAATDSRQPVAQEQAPDDPTRQRHAEAFTELLGGEVQALNGAPVAPGGEAGGDERQVVAADGKPLPADDDGEPDAQAALNLLAGLPVAPHGASRRGEEVDLGGRPTVKDPGSPGNAGAGAAAARFADATPFVGLAHKVAPVAAGNAGRAVDILSAGHAAVAQPTSPATLADGAASSLHVTAAGTAPSTQRLDPSATPSFPIPAPVNSPRWPDQVGRRVRWLINGQVHSAELRLEPPQLGLIQVRIEIHDHQAQVHFDARHAEARAAIDAALPKLRELFAQSGIALGTMNVAGEGPGGAGGGDARGGPFAGGHGAASASPISEVEEARADAPGVLGEGLFDHYA